MPTQSRGFFSCDYCGLSCDTLDEAKEHEIAHCPQRPQQLQHPQAPPGSYPHPPAGPPPPYGNMGPLSNAVEMESYPPPHGHMPPQHHPDYQHHPHKIRCITLMGPNDRGTGLSPEDGIACQNIELFEATPDHAADHDPSRTGGTPVVVKQVGLRCIHCSKSPPSTAAISVLFPGSLGSIAASVRILAENHLSTCGMAPPEICEACDRAARKRRSESGEEGEMPMTKTNKVGWHCWITVLDSVNKWGL